MAAMFMAERWPFWIGGPAIGLFVVLFVLVTNHQLGVSGGFRDACSAVVDRHARASWRLPFLAGIVAGGLTAAIAADRVTPSLAMGSFDQVVSGSFVVKALVFLFGGVLIGFGTALANGCTSGHGIVGMALRSRASQLATASFMAAGFLVTNVLLRALGA